MTYLEVPPHVLVPFDTALSVTDLVAAQVDVRPDAPALRDPDGPDGAGVLSYRELWRRSGLLADALAGYGVVAGSVVALDLPRSADLVVAMLAVARTGAAYLPVDPYAPADRVRSVLVEAGVAVAVVRPGWTFADVVDVTVDPAGVPGRDRPGALVADRCVSPDQAIYLMFTSGSTGAPKGVVVPHRAVVRLVTDAAYCPITPADRCAHAANPAFDAATFEVWGALAVGAEVVVLPAATELPVDEWVDRVRAERITTLFLTTSLFHTLSRERPDGFGTLRHLVVGGEQMELAAVRRVLAAGPPGRLVNGYGPTETTTFAAAFTCTAHSLAGRERVPVGYPLQHTELHVLDDDLNPVPDGGTGELCIGGPAVALGYLARPELTARRFVTLPATGGRVYRTGDQARTTADGAVEVLGRRDRQVKLRGFRIEPAEIEQAAKATGLCDVVVVEKVGEGPAACLVGFRLPAPGAPVDPQPLIERLAARLPAYMVPARWVTLDRLPLGATGKVDRSALLALLDAPARETPRIQPSDPVAVAVRETVSDVLGPPPPSGADGFLALGGNSITAVQVAARLAERLGLPVEPADVLLADTLDDLAARLREPS